MSSTKKTSASTANAKAQRDSAIGLALATIEKQVRNEYYY